MTQCLEEGDMHACHIGDVAPHPRLLGGVRHKGSRSRQEQGYRV